MKETHHLNVTLFVANVDNLSFAGDESDVILSDSIIYKKSTNIFWSSLNIVFVSMKPTN